MCSKPKVQQVTPAPVAPAPTLQNFQETPDVKNANQEQRRRAAMAKGYQSTIATSGLGLAQPASVKQNTLLGS